MRYTLSREAENDLEQIWNYTFYRWSLDQADSYIRLLISEFEFIAKYPASGKDYGKIRKGYWRAKVKSHYIFYRIDRDKDEIEVIRILHERMDVDSRLL